MPHPIRLIGKPFQAKKNSSTTNTAQINSAEADEARKTSLNNVNIDNGVRSNLVCLSQHFSFHYLENENKLIQKTHTVNVTSQWTQKPRKNKPEYNLQIR